MYHDLEPPVAHGASNVRLVCKKLDVLRPGIVGVRGSMVIQPRSCMTMSRFAFPPLLLEVRQTLRLAPI